MLKRKYYKQYPSYLFMQSTYKAVFLFLSFFICASAVFSLSFETNSLTNQTNFVFLKNNFDKTAYIDNINCYSCRVLSYPKETPPFASNFLKIEPLSDVNEVKIEIIGHYSSGLSFKSVKEFNLTFLEKPSSFSAFYSVSQKNIENRGNQSFSFSAKKFGQSSILISANNNSSQRANLFISAKGCKTNLSKISFAPFMSSEERIFVYDISDSCLVSVSSFEKTQSFSFKENTDFIAKELKELQSKTTAFFSFVSHNFIPGLVLLFLISLFFFGKKSSRFKK